MSSAAAAIIIRTSLKICMHPFSISCFVVIASPFEYYSNSYATVALELSMLQ